MGYETKGNGWAVIKKEMVDAAKTVLKSGKFNIHYEFWTDIYHTHQREMLDLEQKGVYDEPNVMAFLNAIKPFVEEGMFKFSGEEGEYWRFKYDPKTGEWEEQSGMLFYEPEEIWEYLMKYNPNFVKEKLKESLTKIVEM